MLARGHFAASGAVTYRPRRDCMRAIALNKSASIWDAHCQWHVDPPKNLAANDYASLSFCPAPQRDGVGGDCFAVHP